MRRAGWAGRAGPNAGPGGFLVVDKPAGRTSHDVVDAARRWLGTRRVGHLGTLDPLATGVLPLAIGDATKLVPFVEGGRKRYRALITLGVATDTLDADGRVTRRFEGPLPDEATVRTALASFTGQIQQVPPMFSAIKRGGVPLHRLARRGAEVERAPRPVTIFSLAVVSYAPPELEITLECSAGTYVRVLASDLGERLGCFGHVRELRRTSSGPFDEAQAHDERALERAAAAGRIAELLISPLDVLGLPRVTLGPADVLRIGHGGPVRPAPALPGAARPGDRFATVDASGSLLAVVELDHAGSLRPLRVVAHRRGSRDVPSEALDPERA
ncbi:MAG: tRNA pseudouridine(55) synthase TruB [Deltaproteobacteria bacterium]|nr:tRNA pseudouridine(55) synthase TruB [Deltaproteobacteria bacterium]